MEPNARIVSNCPFIRYSKDEINKRGHHARLGSLPGRSLMISKSYPFRPNHARYFKEGKVIKTILEKIWGIVVFIYYFIIYLLIFL